MDEEGAEDGRSSSNASVALTLSGDHHRLTWTIGPPDNLHRDNFETPEGRLGQRSTRLGVKRDE